ncbi:DUF5958 family protein [Streptomyces gardneri]|uniref:DUF5958 family protein n=1 Tax=Streptomyces gardneri TaxID=66892 RepID=UPI00369BF23B
MTERDVVLNELAQELRPMPQGIEWFSSLAPEEQAQTLRFLAHHRVGRTRIFRERQSRGSASRWIVRSLIFCSLSCRLYAVRSGFCGEAGVHRQVRSSVAGSRSQSPIVPEADNSSMISSSSGNERPLARAT